MEIDRRTFLFGATLLVATPALVELVACPASARTPTSPPPAASPVFRIQGWDTPAEASAVAAKEVWITLGRSCRAAWR